MNRKQTKVMWIGIIVFVLMGLRPPSFLQLEKSTAGSAPVIAVGHPFILNRDTELEDFDLPYRYGTWRIDVSRLCVQWVLVAAITGGLIVTLRDKKTRRDEPGIR